MGAFAGERQDGERLAERLQRHATSSSASRSTSITRWRPLIQPSVEPLASTNDESAMPRRPGRRNSYRASQEPAREQVGASFDAGIQIDVLTIGLSAQPHALGPQCVELTTDALQLTAVAGKRRVHPRLRAGTGG